MDFVSLLGGIVLGAAGAAILDSKSGFGMLGDSSPAPAPQPAPVGYWSVQVQRPEPMRIVKKGYPVMNRFGAMR